MSVKAQISPPITTFRYPALETHHQKSPLPPPHYSKVGIAHTRYPHFLPKINHNWVLFDNQNKSKFASVNERNTGIPPEDIQ